MDRQRLEKALAAEFGGTEAERRAVARAARDLADSGSPPEIGDTPSQCRGDRSPRRRAGRFLTGRALELVVGALDAAYGDYDYFTVRFVEGDEEAGLRR